MPYLESDLQSCGVTFLNVYLFFAVLGPPCCAGYCPVVAPRLPLQWPPSLQSTGSGVLELQQFWHVGSAAVAHRLSTCEARAGLL